jgi:hypothetical protein
MATATLVKAPIVYSPILKNGEYIDTIAQYRWSEFEQCGVRCGCTKSKTIHRNKNSFKHQHCKTKKHVEYIGKLNKASENNIDTVMTDELEKALKEIKQLKIQVRKEHEGFQLEKQRNQGLQKQIKDIIVEKEEICSEKKQTDDYIEEINKQLINLKKNNTDLTEKLKFYDTITQQMMKLGGYEFE